ncbi:MAG TPA: phage Gp37/Gp68 family protein [Firmicutes bacterium]|nr:phage Gp37/Gp68 family protein [Candidatus Fermentithermobacillaceae bacterium]
MASKTAIEWTGATWNPVTGCSKVSKGCKNCYAERFALRLQAAGNPRYVNGFKVTLHPELLELPSHWKRPRLIFVNSMGDLFHEEVPSWFIQRVFEVMGNCHWHVFQVLTKRPKRAAELAKDLPWPPNVWMGTSVEDTSVMQRIEWLRLIPAHIRFLSLEPLLGPLANLTLDGIHWVIVGGESGPGARPMHPEWVRQIRDCCVANSIPFFFKQWGGRNRKASGRLLDGRTWDELPPMTDHFLSLAVRGSYLGTY